MCRTAPRSSAMTGSGRTTTPFTVASDTCGRRRLIRGGVLHDLGNRSADHVPAFVVRAVPLDGAADGLIEIPPRLPSEPHLRLVNRQPQQRRLMTAAIV